MATALAENQEKARSIEKYFKKRKKGITQVL